MHSVGGVWSIMPAIFIIVSTVCCNASAGGNFIEYYERTKPMVSMQAVDVTAQ